MVESRGIVLRRLPACCGHSVAFCSPRFAFACLLTSNLRPSSKNNILRLFLFLFLLRKLLRRLACKSLTTFRSLVYGFALQRLRLLAQLVHFALMPINNILRLFIGIKPPPRRVGWFVPLSPIKKLPARGSFFYWWCDSVGLNLNYTYHEIVLNFQYIQLKKCENIFKFRAI